MGKFWRGKFWQINGSKVFGEEKFGESVGSLLKTLARGERLWEFNLSRFSNITYHDYDNNHDYDIIQVMQKTITSLCKVAATITLF